MGLPLKSDFSEAKHCYPLLVSLFKTQPAVIGKFLPQVISIASQVLGSSELKVAPEHQEQVLTLCKALSKSHGPQIKTILSQLPGPQRDAFVRAVSSPPSPS